MQPIASANCAFHDCLEGTLSLGCHEFIVLSLIWVQVPRNCSVEKSVAFHCYEVGVEGLGLLEKHFSTGQPCLVMESSFAMILSGGDLHRLI